MGVLEICQLQVKANVSPGNPSVLQSLIEVRSLLRSKVTNTNSRFYQCIEDPTLIYIFGVWPTISAHHDFLSSPHRDEILSPQEALLDFRWIMHMPLPSIESLPLDAPVMAFAWFVVKGGDHRVEFQGVLDRFRPQIIEGSKPYPLVDGWRSDAHPGTQESLVISGWESKQAHDQFTAKGMEDPEYTRIVSFCDRTEVRHLENMET